MRKGRIFGCAAVLWALLLFGAVSAEPVGLDPGRWDAENYEALVSFIHAKGFESAGYDAGRPPYVVFDWDQSSCFNDTEEETFRYQISRLLFAMKPAEFSAAIREGIPKEPFAGKFVNLRGERVGIDDIGADLDLDYDFLYRNYRGFGSGGTMTLAEISGTERFLDFQAKLAWLYEAIGATFSADISYPWVLYLFCGMTVGEVRNLSEEAIDHALADRLETYALASPASLPGRAGQVSYDGYKRGLRIFPEIANLMHSLRSHGIEVYICTASLDTVIRAFACSPRYGYGLPEDHVLGMRTAMESGRYLARYDETWVQTQQAGKTEAIRRVLVGRYGYGPVAIVGDSQGDYHMSQAFPETRLVLVSNRLRKDDFGMLSLRALETRGDPGAKYLLQGRDENLGMFRPDIGTIRYGEREPRILHPDLLPKSP